MTGSLYRCSSLSRLGSSVLKTQSCGQTLVYCHTWYKIFLQFLKFDLHAGPKISKTEKIYISGGLYAIQEEYMLFRKVITVQGVHMLFRLVICCSKALYGCSGVLYVEDRPNADRLERRLLVPI